MADHKNPYGVGLAYRACIHHEVMQYADGIDVLEIPTEDYIVRERRVFVDPQGALLREAVERFPCVAHGISMSIGSVEPYDPHYLKSTRRFMEENGIDNFSEHLAFHRMDGTDLATFLCMPFEEVSVEWLKRKYWAARAELGRPFALENVSYYFPVPNCSLQEAQFLNRLLEETDATLLLDVTNIFNNAHNHGYDPVEFIRSLPGDRVSQLHLAGGHYDEGMWQDSHSAPVVDEVWDLLDEVLKHTAARFVILERDVDFQPFDIVMADVEKARKIFRKHRPAQPEPVKQSRAKRGKAAAAQAFGELDPALPQFADLRNFQRAVLREITDPKFRKQLKAGAELPEDMRMPADWQDRWRGCEPKRIQLLAKKWYWIDSERRSANADYQRMEWQTWAADMANQPAQSWGA